MIECRLIPDGLTELPAEAREQGILASHLESANADIEGNNSVVAAWRDVEREIQREYIALRLPGTLDEYQSAALDATTGAIVNNVAGVKVHPDGWNEV